MTKLEVIRENKKNYATLVEAIKTMEGLEKKVAETLTTEWLSSNNWLGGLSDSKAQKIFEQVFKPMGYSFDEVFNEFDKQIARF